MELIAEITDKTIGFRPNHNVKYAIRRAARAIILNKNKIALIYSTKWKYFKLPGGGIDINENLKKALVREAVEETGYRVNVIKPVGVIIEYKSQIEIIQISYCFLSNAVDKPRALKLTKSERSKGQELRWVSGIDTAIKLVKGNKSKQYEAKFMVARDSLILQKAKEVMD